MPEATVTEAPVVSQTTGIAPTSAQSASGQGNAQAVAQEAPKEDLLARVKAFQPPAAQPKSPEAQNEAFFDIKEIEKIADPRARELAEKAYKSMQSDYTKKTQTLAEQRKAAEEIKKQYEELKTVSSNWTPERIQQLLNDPNFVEAASKVAGQPQKTNQYGVSEEKWSALTEEERAEIAQTKQIALQSQQYLQSIQKAQQDQELKSKYENYNPQAMDTITTEVIQGKRQITREDVWKAVDYDRLMAEQKAIAEKAYQLGRLDAQGKNQEKIQSMAYGTNTTTVTPTRDVPEKLSNESPLAYIKRLGILNMQKVASK